MRLRGLCRELAVSATVACSTVVAIAQPLSNQGTGDSPLAESPKADTHFPDVATPPGYFFNLRPIGTDLGQILADKGVYLNGRTLNEAFGNTSGGVKRGWLYEGFTLFGVDFDMNKIAGIEGGSVHVYVNNMNGKNYFNYSGALYPFNRVWSYTPGSRLNEFSYEQSLFNDQLDVRLGRLPPGPEFDFSEVYCEFITGFCAVPAPYAYTKGYPAYNTSSWAAVGRLKLPDFFYLNAGVYENEPILSSPPHYGFPGEDWGFDKARGAVFPVQFGYRTTYATDPYPKSFDIGGFYNTGDYNDPLLNTNGQIRMLSGGTARLDHGNSGIWLQGQQVVWRPDLTKDRGLTLFGGANFSTSGENNLKDAFSLGASLRGLFPERPNDTINVAGMFIGLNNNYVRNMDYRLKGPTVPNSESYIEVNYGLALAPGILFRPFFSYIWNPDQVGVAMPTATNNHAVFVGAALSISFPEAFGLPRMHKFGS